MNAMNQSNGFKSNHSSPSLKIDIRGQDDERGKKIKSKGGTKREKRSDACLEGTIGCFTPVENDFSFDPRLHGADQKHFRNELHWSREECEKVKRFRFIVATLALIGLLLCLTSRMVMNIGIVEMSKPEEPVDVGPTTLSDDLVTIVPTYYSTPVVTTTQTPIHTQTLDLPNVQYEMITPTSPSTETKEPSEFQNRQLEPVDPDWEEDPENSAEAPIVEEIKMYRIEWTSKKKNYLIGSFYMGYAPSMMFTGGLANKYGSFWPLFLGVFVSFLINAVTPLITSYSYTLLFISRLILGVCQGCIMPAIYDVFNRWLTLTETSIFVPLIKFSFGIGSLLGSALPALTKYFGYDWPYLFYQTSLFCGIWSIAWFMLATSTPQTNRFVEPNELRRIMRKKIKQKPEVKLETKANHNNLSIVSNDYKMNDLNKTEKRESKSYDSSKEETPWLLIALNRSVLGLAVTKFTYNIGADFVCLEISIYLDRIHKAPIETISQICSVGFLVQAISSIAVGWLAKYAVQNKLFGLSKSKWRKAFQGISNFGMSIGYMILAFCSPSFTVIAITFQMIFLLWIFGAGGESIVAYDLSAKYPATITGFAHSIGITSSFILPAVCEFILAGQETDNKRWETIFKLIGFTTLLGGLVFTFLVRPKPFLPGEVEEKRKQSVK